MENKRIEGKTTIFNHHFQSQFLAPPELNAKEIDFEVDLPETVLFLVYTLRTCLPRKEKDTNFWVAQL